MKTNNDSGIALIAVLLIIVLMGALLQTFLVNLDSQQKLFGSDLRSEGVSFAGALSGLEKASADLADALARGAISDTDLTGIEGQLKGRTIGSGNDAATITDAKITEAEELSTRTLTDGNYAGLKAQIAKYTIEVTARTATGEETTLNRVVQIVYIPVFQFGAFSETDLEFSAGGDFTFGGRVHTNGNVHLMSGNSSNNSTLTLMDRVSAVKEIKRIFRLNGRSGVTDGKKGPVRMVKSKTPEAYRELKQDEGNDGSNYENNDTRWKTEVHSQYDGYLSNGKTGAYSLELPMGEGIDEPIDIIRRPRASLDLDSDAAERLFFPTAGVRILLSDSKEEIENLPGIGSGAPVPLVKSGGYVFAESSTASDYQLNGGSNATGAPLIGGYIKIEIRTSDSWSRSSDWTDVTAEILNYGFNGASMDGTCGNSLNTVKDAIIRVQRFKDGLGDVSNCSPSSEGNLWANVLFDSREGTLDNHGPVPAPTSQLYLGGVMHYIELDITNLGKWIRGAAPYTLGSGRNVFKERTGYVVYFSDRRGNQNENARYLYENSAKDTDGDGVVRSSNVGIATPVSKVTKQVSGTTHTYTSNIVNDDTTPKDFIARDTAKRIHPVFFRRALKLRNGSKIELGTNYTTSIPFGLTVASENPVYIQGDYNASRTSGVFNGVDNGVCKNECVLTTGNHSVPAAVIADAVTLLSNSWNDGKSFSSPYDASGGRAATDTYYRTAIISGKNKAFPYGSGPGEEWGSDGGIHNFQRLLEYWTNTGVTMYYDGSMVSLFYAQQANSAFKFRSSGGVHVYSAPARRFYFDSEFSNIQKLPPRTPMVRFIEVLSFNRVSGK